jgi:hypothetical protein
LAIHGVIVQVPREHNDFMPDTASALAAIAAADELGTDPF